MLTIFLMWCYLMKRPSKIRKLNSLDIAEYILSISVCCVILFDQEKSSKISFDASIFPWHPEESNRIDSDDIVKRIVEKIKSNEEIDFSKCGSCNYTANHQPSSTSRDIILLQAMVAPAKVILPLKMLRHVGCRAKIFLIIGKKDYVSPKLAQIYQNCGIFVERITRTYNRVQLESLRQVFLAHILPLVKGYVDRSLYFDGYDSIFQYDPFYGITDRQSIYVSYEIQFNKYNKYMQMWFGDIPGLKLKDWDYDPMICSGVFGGYADIIEKFSQIHTALYPGWNCYVRDQAYRVFRIRGEKS